MHFINETKELTFWHLSLLQSCSKLVLSNFLELPRIKMDRSKKMSKELKIAFVKEVLERKDVLFAKFSTQITSADKTNSWTAIRAALVAKSFDNVPPVDKLRNYQWQNLQTRTKAKFDKSRTTGSGGIEFTEVCDVESVCAREQRCLFSSRIWFLMLLVAMRQPRVALQSPTRVNCKRHSRRPPQRRLSRTSAWRKRPPRPNSQLLLLLSHRPNVSHRRSISRRHLRSRRCRSAAESAHKR